MSSASSGICTVIFLVVAMVFIMIVHINGFFTQVPDNPYLGFLYAPVPMVLSIASVSWLYSQYSGADEGGYKIHIEDIFAQQKKLE
eukprot:05985.XXX_133028_132712_1 [CDS] Oithona nana genome sequencing.